MSPAAPQNLLTIEAVAERLAVSVSGVRKLVKAKTIPAIRLGYKCLRFKWSEVEAAIARRTVRAV